MSERSFIVFKPSHFSSNDVHYHILKQLEDQDLLVENEFETKLTSWQIYNLWYSQCKDRLLYYAMAELYSGNIKVVEIIGHDAINKVHKIKKSTRLTYATGVIRNCIHAPKDLREYKEHINYIRSSNAEFNFYFKELPYNCYRKLTDDQCEALGKYIINIGLYSMIHATIPYENSSNKYRYYLAEDDIHTFTDYVCFICDCFQNFDFRAACVLSTILKTYGEVCLIDTNEKELSDVLIEKAKRYNMKLFFHRIFEL